MEAIAFLIVIFAAFGFYSANEAKKFNRLLEELAPRFDWIFEPPTWARTGCLQGSLPLLDTWCAVTIERHTEGSGQSSRTYLQLALELPLESSFALSKEGASTSLLKLFTGEDFQTGVDGFDQEALIKGDDEATALSYLGSEARDQIHWFWSQVSQLSIQEGRIAVLEEQSLPEASYVESLVKELHLLAQAMFQGGEHPWERLAHHALEDPDTTFRARCLLLLVERFPGHNATKATLKQALKGDDIGLRLLAGEHAPVADAIRALRPMVSDASLAPHHRAAALQTLTGRMTEKQLTPLLQEAIRTPHSQLRIAALEGMLWHAQTPTLSDVLATCEDAINDAIATLPRALGLYPHEPEAETMLLRMLDIHEEKEMVVAIIEALHHVGTARSIEPLSTRTGLLQVHSIKASAKDAIKAIEERIKGIKGVGGLSLVAEEGEGELSLLDDREGALSVEPEPKS